MLDGRASRPALLVFSDDWGRHPSSCQHLVRQLLPRYRVCWVNTIGTRPPTFDLATLKRGWEKIRQWARPASATADLPENLRVLTPKMWPWFRSAADRKLNRELLYRQLAPVIRRMGLTIALTTVPIVADMVGLLPVERWVYYCVDDFGEWPGLDQQTMQRMDEELTRGADAIVAVSEDLQEKIAGRCRTASLLTHGVDLDFWQPDGSSSAMPQLDGLERPLVVFWGVLDRRMDLAFVKRLSADLDRGTIVLVGPESDPHPELAAISRVVRLGSLTFGSLPHLARLAETLIMPYADLPVTRAMQPLKLKEYLATGKPAVVRDLPATRPWADAADLADTPESFSRAVRLRLQTGLPQTQAQARARLGHESWAEKAACLEKSILLAAPARKIRPEFVQVSTHTASAQIITKYDTQCL